MRRGAQLGFSAVSNLSGEEHFRRLVDALDHAVVWEFDDTAQRYTFVSEHSKLVLGYPCTEWMQDPSFFQQHVALADLPKMEEAVAKLRGGEVNDVRLEHRCTKADGTLIWLHTGMHRADENGTRFLRGVTVDINSVKIAEERERHAKEVAERTTAAYEEVMAIISHDLRTPVQTIRMAASALEADPATAVRLAKAIGNSARQIERLIEDLTDLSQIRTRKLRVTPTEVSTEDILRETLEHFAPLAAQLRVELVVPAEPEHAMLKCDAKRITQVLSNIIGNSIKFGRGDGSARIDVSITVDELEATFHVSDNGPGIAHADLERVFEREWQAHETVSAGSGLGLYIAKGIVEAHAGRIWVESIVGRGAAFHFTVPR